MAVTHPSSTRSLIADTVLGQLSSAAVFSLKASASTTIVVTIFDTTAFAAASSGQSTANAITDGTASTAGTVTICAIANSGSTVQIFGSVTSSGGGGDLELSSNVISSGQNVSITSLTYTAPV